MRYFNEIYKETTTEPICQPSDVHSGLVEDVGDDIFKIGNEFDALIFLEKKSCVVFWKFVFIFIQIDDR